MTKIPHLVDIRGRYYCRVRWPKDVWKTLGSGAFKQALGTSDRSEAKIRMPAAMQAFHNQVRITRAKQERQGPRKLGEGEISLLVAEWVREVAPAYKTTTRPRQMDAQASERHELFMASRQSALDTRRKAMGRNDYSALYPILDNLMERNGLTPDHEHESYGHLCRTLMRAWQVLEESAFAEMRGEYGYKAADPILAELEASSTVSLSPVSRSLGELLERYQADKSSKWTQSTKNAYKPVFRLLKDCLGEKRDLRSIDREAAREVFEVIKKLPANLGKDRRLSPLPVPAAVVVAEDLGLPVISAKTINDTYLAHTKAIFKWAEQEHWLSANPFLGLNVIDDSLVEEKRDPFTDEHLRTIFASEPWSNRDQSPNGKPSLYWVPLICMYHGLRVGEPSGMLLEEIMDREGVPTMHVKRNRLRRVKNKPTERYLPIHPELLRLGFLDYVQSQIEAGEEQLFPEARKDSNDHYGDHVTDWFKRKLISLEIDDKKLVTHSFRHTFQDKLREASIEGTVEGAILSGRKQPISDSAKSYGHGYKMPQLLEHLNLLPFPEFDLQPPTAGKS